MRELRDKAAVITGAASGLGRAIANECASRGMRIVLADLDADGAEEVGRSLGTEWTACRWDVSKAADVEALAQTPLARFGSVQLLVNNAGVMTAGSVRQAPLEDWDWLFAVNVKGVVHGLRSFIPAMLKQGGEAHVLNTASLAGLVSTPSLGAYTASKHAVVSLSECLYHELREIGARIGVSVLCPAFVQTGIADAERNRPPEFAADLAGRASAVDNLRVALRSARLIATDVARNAVDGVVAGQFYILPHAKAKVGIEWRFQDVMLGRSPTNPLGPPPRTEIGP